MKRALIILLMFTLAACDFASKYKRPALVLPDEQSQEDYSVFTRTKWWEIFEDDTLNTLENTAIDYNKNLVVAAERVNEARAAAGVVAADNMPHIGFRAAGARLGSSDAAPSVNNFSAGAGASYEIDFWGKRKNLNAAAKARLLSSEAQRDTVRLTLTADVAKAYFALRAYDAKLKIASRTLEAREASVRAHNAKFQKDTSAELSLRRVEAERDKVQAFVLDMQESLKRTETALAVLIGGSPKEIAQSKIPRGQELAKINLVPDIPSDVPSSILQNRPDIRSMEFQLIEAGANIGVARAAYFPSISLTAAGSLVSESLVKLFTGGVWNFAASASGPIFEGGKIKSQVEFFNSRQKELVATYEAAVQNAFKEAYDAISANNINRKAYASRASEVDFLQRSMNLADAQYKFAKLPLVDVLDVERALLEAELAQIDAMQEELNSVVDLSKALGGGFKYTAPTGTKQDYR